MSRARQTGAIEVELFIGTQLCSKGAECLQGVADGSIDVYISTSGGAAGIFPYVQVLDLPYLMADDRVAEHVLSGEIYAHRYAKWLFENSGDKIRLMTIGNTGGWRNFANTKRRVQSPSDMEGLKIRTVVAGFATRISAGTWCFSNAHPLAGTFHVLSNRELLKDLKMELLTSWA
jgi:TRAP-type C4-dicarboxylate transport system substrate-binding protein